MYRTVLALCAFISLTVAATAATTRYEAEKANTNIPTEMIWSGYSGSSYLCCWISNGQYVTFSVNAATAGVYTLAFGYSAGNGAASRRLTVNNTVVVANQRFTGTANWSTWSKFTISLNLVAGVNTVKLDYVQANGSSQYINLDYLDVSPPSSGLSAEWLLNQGSISGTTVADASGNGKIGTIVGGPLTFGSTGANFNGQQYVDSALSVTWPALTVSVWFNPANLNNANPRIVANSHTDVDKKGFQLAFNSGGGSGFFHVGNGTAMAGASWSKQLTIGTWYHYVGVYDGSTIRVYINGVNIASAPFSGGAIAAALHINVARNPAYSSDYFIGAVSDVRVYQKALSSAEILSIYQGTLPAPTPVSISLSPASVTVGEQALIGTKLSTATVTMSDGSPFTGALTTSNTDLFAVSGMDIITKRVYTPTDEGTHTTTISLQ